MGKEEKQKGKKKIHGLIRLEHKHHCDNGVKRERKPVVIPNTSSLSSSSNHRILSPLALKFEMKATKRKLKHGQETKAQLEENLSDARTRIQCTVHLSDITEKLATLSTDIQLYCSLQKEFNRKFESSSSSPHINNMKKKQQLSSEEEKDWKWMYDAKEMVNSVHDLVGRLKQDISYLTSFGHPHVESFMD